MVTFNFFSEPSPHYFGDRFQVCVQNVPLKPCFSDFMGIIIQMGWMQSSSQADFSLNRVIFTIP